MTTAEAAARSWELRCEEAELALTTARQEIAALTRERDEARASLRDDERTLRQISVKLSDAGCPSMTILEGVNWLVEHEATLRAQHRAAVEALEDLAATVRGECPSLLNEDSGGDAELAMRIDAILAERTPASPDPAPVGEA
jgi:hypothetical protein